MKNPFYSLNDYFKKQYGSKFVKLSLDGGFTCPNRDGTLSTEGCIFCSESGSGDFTGDLRGNKNVSFENQIQSQKILLGDKWANVRYMAYLQNFSNSYASPEQLDQIYGEALACEGVEGLAIGTRPDCIDDEIIDIFKKYKEKGIFWVELGLQSLHEVSAKWMNRGYGIEIFESTYKKLKAAEIPLVFHLILGLPGESLEDFLQTVAFVNRLKPFGVKFHMLNVLKGTALESAYKEAPFPLLSQEIYTEWIVTALARLDEDIVIHRLTGDGPKDLLIEPRWILNKRSVLNGIQKSLKENNVSQGSFYKLID